MTGPRDPSDSYHEAKPIMFVEHVGGFLVDDIDGTQKLVTPSDLSTDMDEMWSMNPRRLHSKLSPEEQAELVGPEFILRTILFRMMPLSIRGNPELPEVIFRSELRRFMVSREEAGFGSAPQMTTYGARLVPEIGEVASVGYRRNPHLSMFGVEAFSTGQSSTQMNLHRLMYLEIHHRPVAGDLPDLIPPHEY